MPFSSFLGTSLGVSECFFFTYGLVTQYIALKHQLKVVEDIRAKKVLCIESPNLENIPSGVKPSSIFHPGYFWLHPIKADKLNYVLRTRQESL